MRNMFRGNSQMRGVLQLADLRPITAEIVAIQELQSGSKMRAYADLASVLSVSASWLQKFVTGNPEVKEPSWSIGLKIVAQYEALCDWIDADTERRRRRIAEIKERSCVSSNQSSNGSGHGARNAP